MEKTAARVGVAPNTVRAILDRNPDDFALVKKALATRMFTVAGDAVEIAGERIGDCSAPQAAVVAGIMAQRGTELLQGQSAGLTFDFRVLQQSLELQEQLTREIEALCAPPP